MPAVTTRRSVDLAVPAEPRPAEEPPPANVLGFSAVPRLPRVFDPLAVFAIARRQSRRETEKAVARYARRKERCR